MTETKPLRSPSSDSDDSLVLIESGDVESLEENPSGTPPVLSDTFSHDSEQQQEQQGTPIIATDVQVVEDIPSPSKKSIVSNSSEGQNSSSRNDDETEEVSQEHKIGAGIAIGIMTAPICGPFIAAVAGVAAAYGTTQPGLAGDACRAAGDIALVAKDKAIEVDKKHDLLNKTKKGANQLVDKAKDANERHQIVRNLKKFLGCTLINISKALKHAAQKLKENREKGRASRASSTDGSSNKDDSFDYEKIPSAEVDIN